MLPKWLQSSVDPTEISNRVKGAVLACSSVIILVVTQIFHIGLTGNDVISLATEAGTVAGAIWTVFGSILWLMKWVSSLKPVEHPPV